MTVVYYLPLMLLVGSILRGIWLVVSEARQDAFAAKVHAHLEARQDAEEREAWEAEN